LIDGEARNVDDDDVDDADDGVTVYELNSDFRIEVREAVRI
jgi:hypothetical protein